MSKSFLSSPIAASALSAVWIATLASAARAQEAAGGVTIGCFCVDGVRGQRRDSGVVQTADGTWTPWTYRYVKRAGSRTARLFVFDRAVPPETAFLGCSEIAVKAKAAGARLILSGILNRLDLNARVFQSTVGGESRFQVDAGGLKAELGRVASGSQPIIGGSMELAGALLYITNPSRLLALADRLAGNVEIEAWNRTIVNSTLRLPGGADLRTNLSPVEPSAENITFRLDMGTGAAQLRQARLRGSPAQPILAPSVTVAGITLDDAAISIRNVLVTADRGRLTAGLNGVVGTSTRATLRRPTVITEFPNAGLQWQRGVSAVQPSTDALILSGLSLVDAVFRSDSAEVRTESGLVAIRGKAEARLASLTRATAVGTVRWARPTVPALSFMLPDNSVDRCEIELSGPLDRPRLKGRTTATQFAVGPVVIAHTLSLPFDLVGGSAELRFPLRFAIGPVRADVVFRDLDQTAAVTATLSSADLDGTVALAWPDLPQSRLEIPADRFHLTLLGAVVTRPLLAGTMPAFGNATVAVTNSSPVVAGGRSSGTLRLSSDILALGQPILRVGEKGKESPSSLTLTASGRASLRYDLATTKMSLLKARFLAKDIEFALLDPAGSMDLAGVIVTSPHARVRELSIDIDEEQQPKVSKAAITQLSVNASRVTRPRPARHPSEITFDAVPTQPLSIALVEASRTSISDAVDIQAITIHSLNCALRDASVQFGGGFDVSQASMVLAAKLIASVEGNEEPGYELADVSLTIKGRLSTTGQLHINGDTGFELAMTVNGREHKLNGSGKGKLGGFTGSAVTNLPLTVACTLNLPVEYNFASAGADMDFIVQDGAFGGTANLGPLGLLLHNTSGASCDTPPEEHIISEEKKVSTTGFCCCDPPRWCEWSTTVPKVAIRWHKRFEVHALAGTATLTNPRLSLRDRRLQVCNLGLFSVAAPPGAALVLGGVSPQIDTAFPGADQILNPLISGAFGAVESFAATALANGVGLGVSAVASPAGSLLCLQQ